jgi:PTH1 family peptidyl-tRNA hydrolase
MKYLIVGLGNIGLEYENTRHNVGFKVLDAFAKASSTVFTPVRYGDRAEVKFKGRTLILIKPSTFMNRSGLAVNYWGQKEKIQVQNLLVITDDIALPFGKLRLKGKGSDGGHNGLKHIQQTLGTPNYARLRFGVGGDFMRGQQINYVLGEWIPEETEALPERLEMAQNIIKGFTTIGVGRTMSEYNNK